MSQFRHDFTDLTGIRRLVRWPGFPWTLQALALAVMLGLAWNGWGIGDGLAAADLKTLRKTNLTTLVVWGIWWPCMIVLAVALGRAWCMVCPAELVNRVTDALARRGGWTRAVVPGWVRAGWLALAGYVVLQVLVAGVSIHRVPHLTSLMILALLAGAVTAGLVFRAPRSFCTTMCPVNPLLQVYGRFTAVQVDTLDPSVCATCKTRECVREELRHRWDARSCPSLLRPFAREPGDGCVLCLQCVKVCPHQNVALGVIQPDLPARRARRLRPFEAAFVMVAAGFVTHELVGEVAWLEEWFHTVPKALAALVPGLGFDFAEASWFLALYPALLWSLVTAAAWAAGHRGPLGDVLTAAATGAAPVVAVAHIAKAAAKLTSWVGFLPGALQDPAGVQTWHALAAGTVAAPAAWVGLGGIAWVVLGLVALVGWRSWRWTREAAGTSLLAARVGWATASLAFSAVLVAWTLG